MKNAIAIAIGLTLLVPAVVFGQTRAPGKALVYDFNEDIHNTPSVPAGMSAQNAAKMNAAQNKPQAFVLTLALNNVAPDGSAQAAASLVNTDPATTNAPSAARDAASNFIATLAPDGEIVAQYDANLQPKTGPGGVILNMNEINQNNVGAQVITHLAYFNVFAKGCTAQPHGTSSGAWHETMVDPLLGQRRFDFAKRDGTVTMKSDITNQYMTQTITAKGTCDPVAHLVVTYHEAENNTMTNGPPSSITRDLKLRQAQ